MSALTVPGQPLARLRVLLRVLDLHKQQRWQLSNELQVTTRSGSRETRQAAAQFEYCANGEGKGETDDNDRGDNNTLWCRRVLHAETGKA